MPFTASRSLPLWDTPLAYVVGHREQLKVLHVDAASVLADVIDGQAGGNGAVGFSPSEPVSQPDFALLILAPVTSGRASTWWAVALVLYAICVQFGHLPPIQY